MSDRQQEAMQSFARDVQQAIDDPRVVGSYDLSQPFECEDWIQSLAIAAREAFAASAGSDDEARRKARLELVRIAAKAWKLARDSQLEDAIPF